MGAGRGAVTSFGVVLSAAVPVVVLLRGGWLFAAAALVLVVAIFDAGGQRIARRGLRRVIVARLGEAAWLLGLWLLGAPGWLVALCGGLAWLHESALARTTPPGAGGVIRVRTITVAQPPTRVALTVTALTLGGIAGFVNPHLTAGAVTVVVAVWAALGLLGVAGPGGPIRAALLDT